MHLKFFFYYYHFTYIRIYVIKNKKNSCFSIELKRVLTVEEEILNDSKLFSLSNKKRNFSFDWNHIEINQINLNDFYEQWKKNICKKRSCHHLEKPKDEEVISCVDNPECDPQPMDKIEETCNQLSPIEDIPDKLNDSLTEENEQLFSDKNSRTSLFKLDKSTSTHSLSSTPKDFFTDLFIFEKPSSKNPNLGKHENWIANATASYRHPFHNYQTSPFCLLFKKKNK